MDGEKSARIHGQYLGRSRLERLHSPSKELELTLGEMRRRADRSRSSGVRHVGVVGMV
jgi:hypothetical protein